MARFLVANVFEIVARGRGVAGQIVDGSIAIGMVLHQEHGPTKMEWRVIDIASVYSTTDEANLGLFLENAQELDELRLLLPAGSILVGEDPVFPAERPASMLIDDLRTTLDGVRSQPDDRYLAWPIPSKVDDDIATLIDHFVTGDEALREELMRSLTSPQVDVLTGFAIRMAMLGVREQSVARLRVGLLALALGGSSPESDWRDIASDMPPLEDAGLRIRGETRAAFLEAASIAKGRTAILIRIAAPLRHSWLRWVKRMKLRRLGDWRAVQAPDGFRYVVANPISEAEFMEKIQKPLRESSTKQS